MLLASADMHALYEHVMTMRVVKNKLSEIEKCELNLYDMNLLVIRMVIVLDVIKNKT